MFYQPNKQRGSAIIIALFVVALVAAIATAMLSRAQQNTRRTELILNANQAYLYAQGSLAWAIDELISDWKQQKPQQLIDKTPIQSPINKINNASIQSTIYDAQGFFNVNNLSDTTYREHFNRLIKAVMPAIKNQELQTITLATIDWIAANTKSNTYDDYYAKLNPPYRAPHQPMSNASELRLVKNMNAELYEKLLPHIIALPVSTPISINNATAEVLMSLSPKMTMDSAKTIVDYRRQKPFTSVQNFLTLDIVKNNAIQGEKITITSSYFLVKTQVSLGDQHMIFYTLMLREVKNSQPVVSLLWQSKGTL